MRIGCSLPAMTFMPEYKNDSKDELSAFECLTLGFDGAMKTGYDYIEAAVGVVMKLSDSEVDKLRKLKEEGKFSLEYCNCFVPPELKVCTASLAELSDFVKMVMARLDKLGVKTVIFGSGYARAYPDSMTYEQGIERIEQFLRLCAETGAKYGIVTAVEPLNSTETNLVNTVTQGAELVKKLDSKLIRLLPDAFHMCMEKENPAVICDNADIVAHLHVSEAPGRVFPGKFGGEYLIKTGKALREGGYNGSITVECCFEDFLPEAEKSIKFVKEKML